jgi:hypothetical protein
MTHPVAVDDIPIGLKTVLAQQCGNGLIAE